MRRIAFLLCSTFLLTLVSAEAGEQRAKKTWRDFEQLAIEGAKHFDASDVHDKLLADSEVNEACHPLAPPNEYVRVLGERCRAGYLRAGFADVKVQGRFEDDGSRVVLTVEEGRQYRCGDIKVIGAVNIEPQKLVDWLAAKQPPLGSLFTGDLATTETPAGQWVDEQGAVVEFEAPAWQIGETAKLDDVDDKKLNQAIARALTEQSYPWAKFEVERQLDQRTGLVHLKIRLLTRICG